MNKVLTVEFYTKQHENSIFELKNKEKIINKELYVQLHMGKDANFFMDRYRCFVKMAEKIVPRPDEISYPIWGVQKKENCLKASAKELVYCLEVPKEEVIYFDGLKWDYVLNYLYLPTSKEDKDRFKKNLENNYITDEFQIMEGKYKGMFPIIEKEIRESWSRIFDVEDTNKYGVQTNLWQIKKEWIRRIVHPDENLFEKPTREFNLDFNVEKVKEQQSMYAEE